MSLAFGGTIHRIPTIVSSRRVGSKQPVASARGNDVRPAPARPRDAPIGRRDALKGTARGLAAWTLLPSVIAAPIALADPVELAPTAELAPFVGKAGFFIRYPNAWVRATDRPGTDNGKAETLALVGNFKDIDTVSVRREPMDLHRDFADAATNDGERRGGRGDPGVQGRRRAHRVGARRRRREPKLWRRRRRRERTQRRHGLQARISSLKPGPGSGKGTTQPYFSYQYFTEVCRANIEEGAGGAKVCVGPRGDVLDTVRRVNYAVATESGGYLYLVKASAVEGRWDTVGPLLREVAESFRVPQSY